MSSAALAVDGILAALSAGLDAQLTHIGTRDDFALAAPAEGAYRTVTPGSEWPEWPTKPPCVWVGAQGWLGVDAAYWGQTGDLELVVAIGYAGASEDDTTRRGLRYHEAILRTIDVAVGAEPSDIVPGSYSIICDPDPILTAVAGEGRRYWRFAQARVIVGLLTDRAEATP
jgi:hypothetical protein